MSPAAEQPNAEAHSDKSLGRRAITAGIWLVVAIVLVLVASAVLPRWWSHRIGGQVNGSITAGIVLGLFYGFVFTFVPLALLSFTFRKRRTLRATLVMLGIAVVLAGPNLLTLGIVLGGGNAAHAGQRTLDVEAPDFRTSSLIGVLIAIAALGAITYLVASRQHARRREAKLRDELHPPKPAE